MCYVAWFLFVFVFIYFKFSFQPSSSSLQISKYNGLNSMCEEFVLLTMSEFYIGTEF
jgi:hypothetical protein